MEKQVRTLPTGTLVKRFLPYFGKHKKTVLFDLICAALTTVCELVLPMIVRTITDKATTDPAELTVKFVLMMGGFYLLLRVIDAAANYFMQSVGHIMGSKMETDMRGDLFHHVQKLSFGYYSEAKVGQIMARITSDLFEVTEFAHHCPEEFLIAGVKIIVSFIVLSGMSLPLTLMMFAVLPFMFYFARKFNRRMRRELHKIGIQRILIAVRLVLQGDDLFQNGCIEALGQTHSQCHGLYGIGCYFTGYFIGPLDHNGGYQLINFNLMILIHSGSRLKIHDSSRNFT